MTDRLGAVRQSCCTGGSHVEGGNAGGSAGRDCGWTWAVCHSCLGVPCTIFDLPRPRGDMREHLVDGSDDE
jgi:hypothetical protein